MSSGRGRGRPPGSKTRRKATSGGFGAIFAIAIVGALLIMDFISWLVPTIAWDTVYFVFSGTGLEAGFTNNAFWILIGALIITFFAIAGVVAKVYRWYVYPLGLLTGFFFGVVIYAQTIRIVFAAII